MSITSSCLITVPKIELLTEIDNHKYISFDIFDTIITRNVLQPEEIFNIIEENLNRDGIKLPFKITRVQAGIKAGICANIFEIYKIVKDKLELSDKLTQKILEMEFEEELKHIRKRKVMVEVLSYAIRKKKKVTLISDMYYPISLIEKLLLKVRIDFKFDKILISNEYKKSKKKGDLYEFYLKDKNANECMHIGDNRIDDIGIGTKKGIDTYLVLSSLEILSVSSIQELLVDVQSTIKRNMLGLAISDLFNNPFCLNKTKGYLYIRSFYDLGILISPMIINYVIWLNKQLEIDEIKLLLLPSRDGFLISKILDFFSNSNYEKKYIKASRRALAIATLLNKKDILRLIARPFKGTREQLLMTRFGIEANINDLHKNENVGSTENDLEWFEFYENEILLNASNQRIFWEKYLKKLEIDNSKKIAVFDCVASGTVQFYLEKLIGKPLYGYYFATLNIPNDMFGVNNNIKSAFGNIGNYVVNNNCIGKNYLFLESILSDSFSTLIGFNKESEFIYEGDGLNKNNSYITEIQKGILEFSRSYFENNNNSEFDLNFGEEIFNYIFNNKIKFSPKIKGKLELDDTFLGEMKSQVW